MLPGVERLSKWPKLAFHGVTAVPHQESLSSCRQAIMGQRSIGAGFHTFLRRAALSGSSPKSVIEVEVSFMQRLAWEVGAVNPRFI